MFSGFPEMGGISIWDRLFRNWPHVSCFGWIHFSQSGSSDSLSAGKNTTSHDKLPASKWSPAIMVSPLRYMDKQGEKIWFTHYSATALHQSSCNGEQPMETRSCLIVLRSGGARERYCSSFRGRSTKCILSWKFDNEQPLFHFCSKPRAL